MGSDTRKGGADHDQGADKGNDAIGSQRGAGEEKGGGSTLIAPAHYEARHHYFGRLGISPAPDCPDHRWNSDWGLWQAVDTSGRFIASETVQESKCEPIPPALPRSAIIAARSWLVELQRVWSNDSAAESLARALLLDQENRRVAIRELETWLKAVDPK